MKRQRILKHKTENESTDYTIRFLSPLSFLRLFNKVCTRVSSHNFALSPICGFASKLFPKIYLVLLLLLSINNLKAYGHILV